MKWLDTPYNNSLFSHDIVKDVGNTKVDVLNNGYIEFLEIYDRYKRLEAMFTTLEEFSTDKELMVYLRENAIDLNLIQVAFMFKVKLPVFVAMYFTGTEFSIPVNKSEDIMGVFNDMYARPEYFLKKNKYNIISIYYNHDAIHLYPLEQDMTMLWKVDLRSLVDFINMTFDKELEFPVLRFSDDDVSRFTTKPRIEGKYVYAKKELQEYSKGLIVFVKRVISFYKSKMKETSNIRAS